MGQIALVPYTAFHSTFLYWPSNTRNCITVLPISLASPLRPRPRQSAQTTLCSIRQLLPQPYSTQSAHTATDTSTPLVSYLDIVLFHRYIRRTHSSLPVHCATTLFTPRCVTTLLTPPIYSYILPTHDRILYSKFYTSWIHTYIFDC